MEESNDVKLNTEQSKKLSEANNTLHIEKLVCSKIQLNIIYHRFPLNSTSTSS